MQTKQSFLVALAVLTGFVLPVLAADNPSELAQQGLQALKARQYKEAQKYLCQAAALNPRDTSYQYYSALASFQAGDTKSGKAALNRLFIFLTTYSPYWKPAMELHKKYGNQGKDNRAYFALKDGMLTNWSRREMPLRVYISNGLALPPAYSGVSLGVPKLIELQNWLRRPGSVQSLKQCRSYQPGFASQAKSGISKWNWAQQERLVTFQFVNDPSTANIFVFWAPKLPQAGQAGQTLYLVKPGETRPVIIELRTDYTFDKLASAGPSVRNSAAHEFGHALGIQNHSGLRGSIMGSRQHWTEHDPDEQVSEDDKDTLRAIYSMAPHQTF